MYSILIYTTLAIENTHGSIRVTTTENIMTLTERLTAKDVKELTMIAFIIGCLFSLVFIAGTLMSSPESLTTPVSLIVNKTVAFKSHFHAMYFTTCILYTLFLTAEISINQGNKTAIIFLSSALFIFAIWNVANGYDDAVIEHTKSVQSTERKISFENSAYQAHLKSKEAK